MSDEELYQLTGSWEEAAAMRDEINNAINQYDWAKPAAPAAVAATPAAVEEPATPSRTYSSTDEQGNPIYEDVVTAPVVTTPAGALSTVATTPVVETPVVSTPTVETPVSGLSAVTGGKNTVLEDTSSSEVPVVTTPATTGALTQVTTPVTTSVVQPVTGAITRLCQLQQT